VLKLCQNKSAPTNLFVTVRKAEEISTWSAVPQTWGGWECHWRNCSELLEAGSGSVLFAASKWWSLAWWFQWDHVHHAWFGAPYFCTKWHYLLFLFFFSLLNCSPIWIKQISPHIRMQIFALYVTGSMNVVISPEHRREICRYIYNHQAWHSSLRLHLYLSLRPCWGQGHFAPIFSLWMYTLVLPIK